MLDEFLPAAIRGKGGGVALVLVLARDGNLDWACQRDLRLLSKFNSNGPKTTVEIQF